VKTYTHLSLEERERLFAGLCAGKTIRNISKELQRSHTTLSRELKRNSPYFQEYVPCKAQHKYEKRCIHQRKKAPLKSPEILLYVRDKLKNEGWSPGIISGRIKLDLPGLSIHPETVYRYIYKKENRKETLWQYLTLKRKKRMKLEGRRTRRDSRIKNAISIELRPQKVQNRSEIGHWETDLMLGLKEQSSALLVNIERVSRYTVITKIPNKGAETTSANMIRLLKHFNPKTITSDNGLENAKHEYIADRLRTKYYFCHPYSSFEKGSVENKIGVIRRYIPKGVNLRAYSHTQISKLQEKLNNRPMECLGYLKPVEFLRKEGIMV
jgi:IS30 family transposase